MHLIRLVYLILIAPGNKTDLEPLREVPTQTASDYADGIGALLFETSALANVGILDAFAAISRVCNYGIHFGPNS